MTAPDIQFLDREPQRIAYRLRSGATPTLVFLSGYASDMEGTKALALDGFAAGRGLACVRFDYSGTGASGGRFDEATLDRWIAESLEVVDRLTEGLIVLIGSSMGAWISLHVAQRRPERVRAFIG